MKRSTHITRLISLFTTAMAAFSIQAQAQPTSASLGADTVRGVVYDSLTSAPLQGALVLGSSSAGGQVIQGFTDDAGRFELIASSPITSLTVYHDNFEFAGIGGLDASRPPGTQSWTARLATPSLPTIWARVCGQPMPQKGPAGIVYGTLRLSDDTTRVAGAPVRLDWEPVTFLEDLDRKRKDSPAAPVSSTVRSDGSGEFFFCGIPEYSQAGIIAYAAGLSSSSVLILPDGRQVRRVDLVIADSTQLQPVRGVLTDENGMPVPEATVEIDGAPAQVISGADGSFVFNAVAPGSRMLAARKPGFLPAVLAIDVLTGVRGGQTLRISMQRGVTLEGVKVTARRSFNHEAVEFNRRRLAGMASYLDAREIEKHTDIISAFRSFPSLNVSVARNGDFSVLGNRINVSGTPGSMQMSQCAAHVFVDGVAEDETYLRVLPLSGLASIEVFSSEAFAPARYAGFRGNCAVVLVWTKAFLIR